ncbi:MAG: peptidase C45 [Betaproteobacteria bacterium]|nr:peptidase C45 [Betaproteobacteria bacterium]
MFPILELKGTAFERGRQHGELARARIERSLANYRHLFGHAGLDWEAAQGIAGRFAPVIRELDTGIYEEIEGIALGSGRKTAEILALNARTEILPPTFPEKASPEWLAAMRQGADLGECTAIAVLPSRSASGKTLLAQNWDWLGEQRECLVLLRAVTGADTYLTLTEAGMVAKIGLNSRGLGVCLNILRSLHDGLSLGVPVHVVLRKLLGCADVAEAERLLRRLKYASSSNILCADAGGGTASFELSPTGIGVVRQSDGTLCHTNHFLIAAAQRAAVTPPASLSSEPRLARAETVARERARHDLASVKALLRDETDGLLSICRRPDPSIPGFVRVESVASVVMELAGGVMHVAPGVPSRCEYEVVALQAEATVH